MNNIIGEHGIFRDGQNVGTVTVLEEGLKTVLTCACEALTGGVYRLAAVSGDEFVSIGVVAPEAGRLRLRKSYTKSALTALRLDDNTSFYLILPGETLRELKTQGDAPAVKLTLGARSAPEPEEEAEQEIEPRIEPNMESEPEPEREAVKPPEVAREFDGPAVPELSKPEPPPETPQAAQYYAPELPPDDTPPPDTNRDMGPWKPIRDPSSLFSDGDISQACKNASGALTTQREGFDMLAIPVGSGEPFPMMPVFCFGMSEIIGGEEYIVFKTKNGNLAV